MFSWGLLPAACCNETDVECPMLTPHFPVNPILWPTCGTVQLLTKSRNFTMKVCHQYYQEKVTCYLINLSLGCLLVETSKEVDSAHSLSKNIQVWIVYLTLRFYFIESMCMFIRYPDLL